MSVSEDEASQHGEGSQSKIVQPPEQPAREELAIAILTLRKIQGQDVTDEDQAALAAVSIDLLNQELENRVRLIGGHKPDRGEEVPARPSSAQVIASQLLRGSLVVSKLFADLGKQIPQLTFPAEMGELPAQLDEIYQRGEAVFRAQDERQETGSRLRTLLTDLERWLGLLRPVAKQTVTAIVLYATTYAARDAFRQALKLA